MCLEVYKPRQLADLEWRDGKPMTANPELIEMLGDTWPMLERELRESTSL